MPSKPKAADVTDDAVLGGRLNLLQPARGHRAGHDAILLAAAAAPADGDHVIDLGAGVGTAGLALAVRCPSVRVTLVEHDAELAALAAENIFRNRLDDRAFAVALDVAVPEEAFAAAGLTPGKAQGVIMNPPFNDPARHKISRESRRARAHAAAQGLEVWCAAAGLLLAPKGILTMIWRADGLRDVLAALSPGFGGVAVLPVHPQPGAAAIRVLVSARKGSRAPLALLPGLCLQDGDGKPADAAEAVLRHAAPLKLLGQ